jgi:diaminopimelate decarboxylase
MDDFRYVGGRLACESVLASAIAAEVRTPAYIYSTATLRSHYDRFVRAFEDLSPTICFSVKSCPNVHICRLLAGMGSGFDVVSGGELHRVLRAGGDPARTVYAGVGKTDGEIEAALRAGVGLLNVESEAELENLIRIATRMGATPRAALRINPDVDARTHRHTTTGTRETKFGVAIDCARTVFERHARRGPVRLCGLHLHIGSPVNSVEPYARAITKALALIDELRSAGFSVDTLDIGGGFGAHYRGSEAPDAATYAAAIVPLLAGRDLRIIIEPGRSIAANAGVLLTRVLYVKETDAHRWVVVDAGMNDLIRPALYDAYHFIWPAEPGPDFVPATRGEPDERTGLMVADVVGPVCETGDFLGRGRRLPPMTRGDLLAVFTAGAYGMSMASQYNSRPRACEVLVDRDRFRVIRRRETYDDLIAAEDA